MKQELLEKARNLLKDVTPMVRDCGRSCAAACCEPDEDGQGGVYLFPGEAALLGGCRWGKIEETDTALGGVPTPMLMCAGPCEREYRPLACRMFPLTPEIGEDGNVDVRFDIRARAVCPLVRYGMSGIRQDFAQAVREALTLIASDPEGMAFLKDWQALEEQYDLKL